MALLVTDGDTIEIRVCMVLQAQIGLNIFHYSAISHTGTGCDYPAVAAAVSLALHTLYKATVPAVVTFRGVGARKILPLPISVEYPYTAHTGAGTYAGTEQVKQVSGILRKFTETAGRSGRGRVYLPFPSIGATGTDGKPVAGYTAAADALGTAMAAQITCGTVPNQSVISPVVNSRRLGSRILITSIRSQLVWATQRRRGDYGKTNLPPF